MVWREICRLSELRENEMRRVDLEDAELLVVRIGDRVFVTDAWCTHQRSDLTLGILEGKRVRCALHQALFDLETGEVLEGPSGEPPSSIRPLRTYRVRVEGDVVLADL
ncbi:MAG: Rieske (2Fe-2S) protein [Nitrososphaerota archaeon]|nr:Rieske (2Fe-2S) protein [Candidatus Calditenuis fumarioli]